jgi:pimeloyl-ACP methyl ester carboxylesterase
MLVRVLERECRHTPVLLVGHGAGCYVAMHLAGRAPERIAAIVGVGDIPNYLSTAACTGCFHRVYTLEWTRFISNNCMLSPPSPPPPPPSSCVSFVARHRTCVRPLLLRRTCE